MPNLCASLLGRAGKTESLAQARSGWPTPGDVERRCRSLRQGVMGLAGDAGLLTGLKRLGYVLRVDDITRLGVTSAAPVNTWALQPGPRRAVWAVHRDRPDPWLSETNIFVTGDGRSYLAASVSPTKMPGDAQDLSFRIRCGRVCHEADGWGADADGAGPMRAGRVPTAWLGRKSGWLAAADAGMVTASLAELVSGMVREAGTLAPGEASRKTRIA